MINLKSKNLLIFDNGSFFEVCLGLADYYKTVYYYNPWDYSGFPTPDKARIGSEWKNGKMLEGFDSKNFIKVESFWDCLEHTDVILFTDCYQGDLMEHLREMGYPVCGSGKGQILELDRWHTMQEFKSQGMDVTNAVRVVGLSKLKEYLKKVKDKWIKISKYRKIVETFHHNTYELSQAVLEKMEFELGPLKETIEFIICDPIEALVEEGIDIYTVEGEYPETVFAGVEVKDKAYYGEVMSYGKLSKGVQKTCQQLQPLLKKYGYKGFYSTEVRTTKDNKNFLIDFTARFPMPPSPLFPMIYKNLGEVIWETANGNLINMVPKAKCGLYLSIITEHDEANQCIYFPEEYRDNIKLSYPVKIDGKYSIINSNHFPEIGSICTVGNSYEECYKQMEKIVPTVKGYGLVIDIANCEKAHEEFLKMQKTNG